MVEIKLPAKKHASNQPQTPPKTPEAHSTVTVSEIFIDKLSLVINLPAGEDANDIYTAVMAVLSDKDLFADASSGKSGGYQIAKRLKLESVVDFKRLPLVQFKYDKAGKIMTSVRLEFVPVDLGPQGVEELKIAINTFLPDWQYVLDHAHVTRIDISVDLLGVRMDSFLFMPKQAATTTQWQFGGKLRSFYSGKSSGNQTKIYDRKAKRLAKGQNWQGATSIRIERKLTGLKSVTLPGLLNLPNPFGGITLLPHTASAPLDLPASKAYVWSLFSDAVKVRGLTDALALLPDDQRTRFRKHIKTQNAEWWNPNALWSGWSAMLDDLKLLEG